MKVKTKKILLRLFNLIIITFIVLNLMTSIMGVGGISNADSSGSTNPFTAYVNSGPNLTSDAIASILVFFTGLPYIFLIILKLLIMLVGLIGQLIMYGIYSGFEGSGKNWVTIEDIIFAGSGDASKFLDVNFFDFSGSGMILTFRESVAKWYYILRLISAAILLVILIYVGIKMALSTIGQEQARYKEMFVDWVQSVALLFLLHYIIIFIIQINKSLVDALVNGVEFGDTSITGQMIDSIMEAVWFTAFEGFLAAFIYVMMVGQIFAFFYMYVKRMITVGFLIMISPLITITYSIDKMGDKKAQALNAWLKELAYNILIQPFHCVIFLAFYGAISEMIKANTYGIAPYIFAIIVMNFMRKAEDILKHIFHFEARHMSSMSDAAQALANANGTFMKFGKSATKAFSSFHNAGGFRALGSGVKDFRDTQYANKKTKETYEAKKKDGTIDGEKMSFKDYKATEEGKKVFEEAKQSRPTTAKKMKEVVDKRREIKEKRKNETPLEKEMRKIYDGLHGDGSYDKAQAEINEKMEKDDKGNIKKDDKGNPVFKNGKYSSNTKKMYDDLNTIENTIINEKVEKATKKQMGKEKYEELKGKEDKGDVKANESLNKERAEQKKKIVDKLTEKPNPSTSNTSAGTDSSSDKPKKSISGISKAWDRLTNPRTEGGKAAKALMEDSTKVVSAIAFGGMALGATGQMQDAISAGQFGYGLASGLLENSTNTVVKDVADKMEKLLRLTGENTDAIDRLLEEIKEKNALGMYKDLHGIEKKLSESFIKYLPESDDRRKLLGTIHKDIVEEGKEIDIDKLFDKFFMNNNNADANASGADADKIKESLRDFVRTVNEAEIAKGITNSESIGMQIGTLGRKTNKRVTLNLNLAADGSSATAEAESESGSE